MAANSCTVEMDIPLTESEHLYIGTFTPSTSFPATGEVVDIPGNTHIRRMLTQGAPGGYVSSFDEATQTLKFYRSKDPGNAGGADLPLQVLNTTGDISATPMPYIAIGS